MQHRRSHPSAVMVGIGDRGGWRQVGTLLRSPRVAICGENDGIESGLDSIPGNHVITASLRAATLWLRLVWGNPIPQDLRPLCGLGFDGAVPLELKRATSGENKGRCQTDDVQTRRTMSDRLIWMDGPGMGLLTPLPSAASHVQARCSERQETRPRSWE